MNIEQIKKYLNSGAGQEMKDHLLLKLRELKSIENVKEKNTPTHQSIEIKAQKRAYLKLKEILSEIMTLSEEVRSKDPRDQYGIE